MSFKVLVADKFERSGIQGLEAAGCEVVYEPDLKDEALSQAIASTGADVLVVRGTTELERLVDSGRAAVAFSMHPVGVDDMMAIADAGGIMPPKSTWFEPKLRDGLLSHLI